MKVILVVEADPALSFLICDTLATAGFEAVPCAPEQAQALAVARGASAIVLALASAQLDKAPLYLQLHADPRTAGIPLVLCTGHRNATVQRKLGEKPAYVLFKPFQMEYLVEVVRLALKEAS